MSAPTRTRSARRVVLALATLGLLVPAPPAAAAREHTIGAFLIAYVPDNVAINNGDTLAFVNTDPASGQGHTVTQATPGDVPPLFDSGVVALGESAEVAGVSELSRGKYLFYCRVHPFMKGYLFVGGDAESPTERLTQLIF